ncbi:alpha/beta hydrolase [Cellvibrio sp. KY-GH-1]|uniref:alpha/beta hydrolase n=1 Tax=Cellvibrio sp. KY-GH-1 TaxID=2303332 RepID=UPI0012449115|nr:alpha/beta hydrolase-fold protein [Cellvibrio sp. KY-GH-1]QEY18335.1 alpha/beta hydrolase [Cellvibrio sp. KY-GH-1]
MKNSVLIRNSMLAMVLLLVSGVVGAQQESDRSFVIGNSHIIPIESRNTGRQHELVIILPSSYQSQPTKKYPVLYYLDAYWDTPLLASTYGNLIYDNEVPEFIMVGLSYPEGKDYGKERRLDYTFTPVDEGSGKSDQFLAFIKTEVAPLIEKQYRGLSTDRVLSGNSLGGLFTLTAAYKAPEFFSGFIAISPAVEWDNKALIKFDQSYAKDHQSLPGRVFISYGAKEYSVFREPIAQFQTTLAERKYQGLALQNYVMEDLDHTAVKGDGYVRGLKWVWKPKKPAGPSGLEKAYLEQPKK